MSRAHEILGVSPDASAGDVRRAFRRLVLALHPDRTTAATGADREAELLAAIAAYEELTGKARPARRRRRPAERAPARPFVRDRYNCGGCGDTFAIDGECPRCDLPLAVTERPSAPERPEVEAFEARLSAPPGWLTRTLAPHAARLPAVALAGCLLFGAVAMSVHPPIALLTVGYALVLFAVEAWTGLHAG